MKLKLCFKKLIFIKISKLIFTKIGKNGEISPSETIRSCETSFKSKGLTSLAKKTAEKEAQPPENAFEKVSLQRPKSPRLVSFSSFTKLIFQRKGTYSHVLQVQPGAGSALQNPSGYKFHQFFDSKQAGYLQKLDGLLAGEVYSLHQ